MQKVFIIGIINLPSFASLEACIVDVKNSKHKDWNSLKIVQFYYFHLRILQGVKARDQKRLSGRAEN